MSQEQDGVSMVLNDERLLFFYRYFSPYPLTESEVDELALNQPTSTGLTQSPRIPGVHKVTARSHGRTSDLLAGGLGRTHASEKSILWVCEMCFKYMADGSSYELHVVRFCRISSMVP